MGELPDDDALLRVLTEAASSMPEVAQAFHQVVLADPQDRDDAIERVGDVESDADERYEAALTAIAEADSPHVPRQDLYSLAEGIDDVVDAVDNTCQLMHAYEIGELPDGFLAQAEDFLEMADLAADAVGDLDDPDALVVIWRQINELQTLINDRHRIISAILLDGSTNVFVALKLKEVAESIEMAADLVDQYIRTLALVVLKGTGNNG